MAGAPAAKFARLEPAPTAAHFAAGKAEFEGDSARWSGLFLDRRWAVLPDALDIDRFCSETAKEDEFLGRELSEGEAIGAAAGLSLLHELVTVRCHMRIARTDRGPPISGLCLRNGSGKAVGSFDALQGAGNQRFGFAWIHTARTL